MSKAGTPALSVCFETGERWVFAGAVDWPGWCRRDRSDKAALDTLLAYASRYSHALEMEDRS